MIKIRAQLSPRYSVGARFGWVLLSFVFLSSVAISVTIWREAAQLLTKESEDSLLQIQKHSMNSLQAFVDVRHDNLEVWASSPILFGYATTVSLRFAIKNSVDAFFDRQIGKDSTIVNALMIVDREIIYQRLENGEGSIDADDVQTLQSLPEDFLSVVSLKSAKNRSYLAFRRLLRKDGVALEKNSIFVLFDFEGMNKFIVGDTKIRDHGFVSLFAKRSDGTMVLPTQEKKTNYLNNALNVAAKSAEELLKSNGDEQSNSVFRTETSEAVVVGGGIPKQSLGVVGVVSREDIRSSVSVLTKAALTVGFLLLLLASSVALFLANRFSRPIVALASAVQSLATGNFKSRAAVHSEDELGDLGRNFNTMALSLEELISNIEFLQETTAALVAVRSMENLANLISTQISKVLPGRRFLAICHDTPKIESELLAELAQSGFKDAHFTKFLSRPSSGDLHGLIVVSDLGSSVQERERFSGLFKTMADACELSVENICALHDLVQKVTVDNELKMAAVVQECLLSTEYPEIAGYEIGSFFRSASSMGGDWFRVYFQEERNCLHVYVGDVTGHGISSALITAAAMAVVHTLERDMKTKNKDLAPSEVLDRLSYVINEIGRGSLCMTLLSITMNLDTGEATLINAAHNFPFVINTKELGMPSLSESSENVEKLPDHFSKTLRKNVKSVVARGNHLGRMQVSPESQFGVKNFSMEEGAALVCYTDGIIEGLNEDSEQYGENRFKQSCLTHALSPAQKMASSVEFDFDSFRGAFPLQDDVSFVVIKRLAK